jgi:hypothetical protein
MRAVSSRLPSEAAGETDGRPEGATQWSASLPRGSNLEEETADTEFRALPFFGVGSFRLPPAPRD